MGQRIVRGEAPPTNDAMKEVKCEFCDEAFTCSRTPGNSKRRACDKPECKAALKAQLQRDYRNRETPEQRQVRLNYHRRRYREQVAA
jgi:hypothetical protein